MNHPTTVEMIKERGLAKTKKFYFNSGIMCWIFSAGGFIYYFVAKTQSASWYKVIIGIVVLSLIGTTGKWLMNKTPLPK
jgi:hypothetical protein